MALQRERPSIVRWLGGLLLCGVAVAAVTGVVTLLEPYVPVQYSMALYVLVVMPIAARWGTRLGAFAALLSALVFEYLFVPPKFAFHLLDPANLVGALVFFVAAVIVGRLASRLRRAASESARLTQEQAALRRIATLVAGSAPQLEVFEGVTREVGLLCGADVARMERYEADGTVTGLAAWSRLPIQLSVGTRFSLSGPSIAREVLQTNAPARVNSFEGTTGAIADEAIELGIGSSVGCPIMVSGRLWGVIAASTRSRAPFPPNTESQIGSFTELVATAIANEEGRADLAASRARVVTAADETRKRLERNLHDGAQQRIVSLALKLRLLEETLAADQPELQTEIRRVADELGEVLDELRDLSHGLHPAILSKGGLGPALRAVARRSPVPVELQLATTARYPSTVEVSAYYAVAESLTNVAKHAEATKVEVSLEEDGDTLRICIRDNGNGGADPRQGSGIIGLRDRAESLGGTIDVSSPVGNGTTVRVSLPIEHASGPG